MSEPEKEILPAFIHWTFFETIDEDLYAYSRYLEFNPKNYGAFSINLARLYLSICSEVDVLAKMLCAKLKEPTDRSSIEHYRKVITKRYPIFAQFRIQLRPMSLIIQPWANWINSKDENPHESKHPPWWNSYNKVKHERNLHFDKANLENVLWSGAGLLVMLIYFCAEAVQNRQLNIEFRIFQIPQNMQNLILNGYFLSQAQAAGFSV